jgi:antitoxin MazE
VVSKGQVIITAIDKVEYDLDTLVSGINAKNTHDEVSFGAPVGKEAL